MLLHATKQQQLGGHLTTQSRLPCATQQQSVPLLLKHALVMCYGQTSTADLRTIAIPRVEFPQRDHVVTAPAKVRPDVCWTCCIRHKRAHAE